MSNLRMGKWVMIINVDDERKNKLLVEIFLENDVAQAFVKPEIMSYINAKLTHEDCFTCIQVYKKDF